MPASRSTPQRGSPAVRNISAHGALIEVSTEINLPAEFALIIKPENAEPELPAHMAHGPSGRGGVQKSIPLI
jgi:hypothetical protein